ncbi:MAG: ABC transporter substrate-binding protein [Emergencia sp.]|nr:ABC transporter substrate-binding protein [Emergencia sp.]
MKFTCLAAVLALTVLMVSGCTTYDNFKDTFFGEKVKEGDTIKIGVLEPQTGNDSSAGELEIRGIELAKSLQPEVLGKPVELLYADTQSSIYVAETAVQNLIEKKPAAVLGSYGEAVSLTASQLLGEAKIPAITITATNPLITVNNDYYFRMSFSDGSQGRALADYTVEKLQLKKAGVLRVKGEDASNEMVNQFSSRLHRLTDDEESVSVTVEIPKETKDRSPYIEKLRKSGVEAVFMPVSVSLGEKIISEADQAGLHSVTFLVPKDWHSEQMIKLQNEHPRMKIAVASDFNAVSAEGGQPEDDTAGEPSSDDAAANGNSSGDTVTGGVSSDQAVSSEADESAEEKAEASVSALYKSFAEAYEKKYGSKEIPEPTALAFDAYMLAVQSIEKAGSIDSEAVQKALLATRGFRGVSGEISFNESGEPKKTINIDIVQNGQFVTVFTVA